MCGRFALFTASDRLAQQFSARLDAGLPPRYNIAPTQAVLALRDDGDGDRTLNALHWGLIPHWAKDRAIGNKMINARSETAHEKPAFRDAFRKRRCLIAADSFYEWQRSKTAKQPFYIGMKDRQPFCFAGLWAEWRDGEQTITSCTILTTEAGAAFKPIHHRMPIILPEDRYDDWLNPASQQVEPLQKLLEPLAEDRLDSWPVSTHVNNPRHDDPSCIEPLTDDAVSD